jgi:CDP-paratose 2-epimerase
MSVAVITGSAGLIGSEAASFFAGQGFDVVGIDNDMRSHFFGAEASTAWNQRRLKSELGSAYYHCNFDIRDAGRINRLFANLGKNIELVIHAAAQPSHDWAARDPNMDFSVNAMGTLNVLEASRQHCPDAPFIFTSTNKVYGDRPNRLPLIELVTQEYGRYFGMKTGCFRGGCLTGPNHSGAQLHGFLAYLMRCTVTGHPYTVFGYQGKQVRDNIHCSDLIDCFYEFFRNPRSGEVYNIGGGRASNASMMEAIQICEEVAGRGLHYTYKEENRMGDHIWWISDTRKFSRHYPAWKQRYNVAAILREIFENNLDRWAVEVA